MSDFKNPKEISRYKPISAEGVFVSKNYRLFSLFLVGDKIFDISNPNSPNLIFEKDLSEETEGVFIV